MSRFARVTRPLAVFAPPRPALTLVEIILVLALLVIIGAIAAPQLSGTMSRARLGHGGELLRAAWAKARLAAMQSGETQVFRYQPQGSQYQIVPLASLNTPGAAPVDAAMVAEPEDVEDIEIFQQSLSMLPQGVVFASGQLAEVPQLAAAAAATGGAWSAPILFYADGSTSDAVITLASNDTQVTLRVTLRGMTGVSRASEIGSEVLP